MSGTPDERYMQKRIVEYLCSQPIVDASGNVTDQMEYHEVSPTEYDRDSCLMPSELFAFLKASQGDNYRKWLTEKYEGDETVMQRDILTRIKSEMAAALKKATKDHVLNGMNTPQGTLTLLRDKETIDCGRGMKFSLAYFKPANNKTPEHDVLYRANRLAITQELVFSDDKMWCIDLAIFLNGFPIVTVELKNTLSNQTHHNAIKQYMTDRPAKDGTLLQFKRCMVHFAVGSEQAFMTTRLAGDDTRFFPFNQCFENRTDDPDELKKRKQAKLGYATYYIWEDVLRRDNLMDLLQNFITVQVEKERYYDDKKRKFDEKVSEALIFPRYHQRRAVHKLVKNVIERGAGHRYLIQHSAGSGKSNTITWLAFRLSNLYQHAADDRALFDCVLVVTDRRVLNEQMKRNVKQFAKVDGEVWTISDAPDADGHTSKDLQDAIEKRRRIIITTIQKFPFISDAIAPYPNRKYAVIIDEAHSSQSGENARQMRKALSLAEAEKFDGEDEKENDEEMTLNEKIEAEMKRKGDKQNVSFFAFTATPKGKTIELFCEREYGAKDPFDCYTMEEAIKEEFILDVLKGYMSFSRYYKLVRKKEFADKEYDKKKTVRLLTSYVDLQDAAIEKKSRIMVEHFASQTQNELEGKARAMLVTRSRLHAVRYKLKFDSIMQEMRLPYRCLVAFSGTVKDSETNEEYTEKSMNGLEGNLSIPEALKMPQYRILIVANKFQTGFDEPLLQTMFVDKLLGGANAVQTLSRLNRCKRGKDTTMVLDFVNDPDAIRKAFQEYYNKNKMMEEDETDPNTLYDVKSKLAEFNVYTKEEVDEFAKYWFEDDDKDKVNIVLDKVCNRAVKQLDKDACDKFRKLCKTFNKLFTFLSQIITFTDAELEKLSAFSFSLAKKLPYVSENLPYDVLKESELDSYKVKYQGMKNLSLESGDTFMKGMGAGQSTTAPEEDYDWLSNIIKVLNDTYGVELTEEDRVDLLRMRERVESNEELMSYFNPNNARDDVRSKFDEDVDSELLNFINTKLELYNKLTEEATNAAFKRVWFNELYDYKVRGMIK